MPQLTQWTELYSTRQALGTRRQPRHSTLANTLSLALEKVGAPHPFCLNDVQRRQLAKEVQVFGRGSDGLFARVPQDGFLYRLCSINRLVSCTTELLRRYPQLEKEGNDDDNYSILRQEFDVRRDWLPYDRYARGYYWGYRDRTWWTTLNLFSGDLVCNAHKTGLPNDRMPFNAVVLRCRGDNIKPGLARVPTVVDGFDSAIFCPTRDSDRPARGVTISVEASERLTLGADEVVLGRVEVEKLTLWPIRIDNIMTDKHQVVPNDSLLRLLANYYSELLETDNGGST